MQDACTSHQVTSRETRNRRERTTKTSEGEIVQEGIQGEEEQKRERERERESMTRTSGRNCPGGRGERERESDKTSGGELV